MKQMDFITTIAIIAVATTILSFGITNAVFAQIEDVDWSTFKNSDYGFSIEYPKDLEDHDYINIDSNVVFYNFDMDINSPIYLMSAILNIHPNNMTLLDYVDKAVARNGGINELVGDPTAITVDGNAGYTYSTISSIIKSLGKSSVFVHDDNIYELIVIGEGANGELLYNHMLNSIKFEE